MSFAEEARRLFGTSNLYEILHCKQTSSTISQTEIKKAFFKQSLKYHPDRCSDNALKAETTVKFQILNRAYSILADKQRRALYDETGIINEDEVFTDDMDWRTRWRTMFKLSKQDIDGFIQRYRDSGEEREAVKEAYLKYKGDMGKIMNDIIGVSYEDEDRLRNIINEMIETGELKAMRYFVAEPENKKAKRRKAAEREAKEAEEMLREVQAKEGADDLFALIQSRQKKNRAYFDQFCDSLAMKYAKKPKRAK